MNRLVWNVGDPRKKSEINLVQVSDFELNKTREVTIHVTHLGIHDLMTLTYK